MEFSGRRIYAVCERIGPGFWDEPANALTNAAFVVVALLAYLGWRRERPRDWPALFLIVNVAVIGLGSFLFHSFATRWALTLDVVPIQVFIAGCLGLALRRFLGLPWLAMPLGILALWGAAELWRSAIPFDWGWRWRTYGTALMLLGVIALAMVARGVGPRVGPGLTGPAALACARRLALAGGVFTVSLLLVTNDRAWCDVVVVAGHRFGTHPAWHLLNALTCWLLLRAMLAVGPARVNAVEAAGPAQPLRA